MSQDVTIIGAGSVGVNAAIFLDKLGFNVTLLESASDILEGAPQATFVTHGDGFEYFKKGHQTTGEYCIDGAITKQLLYPAHAFKTDVCNPDNPIRFLVSDASNGIDSLTIDSFVENAEYMRAHYTKRYEQIAKSRGEAAAKNMLVRTPETFARPLDPKEYRECANIAGGYAGSSKGINMPQYYAFLKAALRQSNIKVEFNQGIKTVKKDGDNYDIETDAGEHIASNHIIIAASHHTPELVTKIKGAHHSAEGTYYLNAMVFVKLPATTDKEKIRQTTHINFTLQQEGGCMFACVVPPTPTDDGLAVIYYPSEKGSQFAKHLHDKTNHTSPPQEWDNFIKEGLPNTHQNVRAVMKQAHYLYPFLKSYAVVEKTICRPVFNAATPESDKGRERRIRDLIGADILTEDGHVTAFRSPKWTNAELVALMAVNHTMQTLRGESLAHDNVKGFGPEKLDVEQITQRLHFKDLKMKLEDALYYARKHGLPERMVDATLEVFEQSPKRTQFLPREGRIVGTIA